MGIENLGNPNGFWTSAPNHDPKRGFRFQVRLGQTGILWYAKKADKPTLSFGETEHHYLNHKYYWPGKAEWNEITLTLVDPVEPDLAGDLIGALEAMGYRIPAGTGDDEWSTPSKKGAVETWGGNTKDAQDDVQIIQIDAEGKALETWTLKHAWIKEVTFGELDYSSEDLTEVTIKFRYDWATFESGSPAKTLTQEAFKV
jgi:hypothetical protein